MRVRTLAAVLLLVTAGCFIQEDPEATKRVEPTAVDLKILKVEGIRPYSEAGQKRLRKLAGERKKLKEIQARRATQAKTQSR